MPIKFNCPHCQHILSVKDELAGRRGPCPSCKHFVTVPGGPAAAPAAGPPPAPRPRPAAQTDDDLEAAAAALLADDTVIEDEGPAFIDFPCPYCSRHHHVGVEMAGRKLSCLNPECRRILHVPKPLSGRYKGNKARR
jgi:hypothetical protein